MAWQQAEIRGRWGSCSGRGGSGSGPADVGLPAGSRRRTAGLRREEVAGLANLSTTYYTFLEQGRPVRPSAQVLDAAGRGAAHVRRRTALPAGAGARAATVRPVPRPRTTRRRSELDPSVADLVQRLDPFPALVKGRRWDVLAANQAARELFTDWQALPARSAQPGALDVH